MIEDSTWNFSVRNNQVSTKYNCQKYRFCFCCFLAVMYNVEVQTGDEQIDPLDSPVYMQIYGTTTTTPKLFLESKNASFAKNSTSKFSVSSNNVGEVMIGEKKSLSKKFS